MQGRIELRKTKKRKNTKHFQLAKLKQANWKCFFVFEKRVIPCNYSFVRHYLSRVIAIIKLRARKRILCFYNYILLPWQENIYLNGGRVY